MGTLLDIIAGDESILDDLTDITFETEGLIPGQTPLRITNRTMQNWNTIQGVPIDKTSPRPSDRRKFFFVPPGQEKEVVRRQWHNYFKNPEQYGITTIEDAVRKFDQQNPEGKLRKLREKGYDIRTPIKKFNITQLLGVGEAQAAEPAAPQAPTADDFEGVLKQQEAAKQQMAQDAVMSQVAQAQVAQEAADDPKNWTLKETKERFKANPPRGVQEEAAQEYILKQKKEEKEAALQDIAVKDVMQNTVMPAIAQQKAQEQSAIEQQKMFDHLARVKRNVAKMAEAEAPVEDIDGYIASEGLTVEDIQNFVLPKPPVAEISAAKEPLPPSQPMSVEEEAKLANIAAIARTEDMPIGDVAHEYEGKTPETGLRRTADIGMLRDPTSKQLIQGIADPFMKGTIAASAAVNPLGTIAGLAVAMPVFKGIDFLTTKIEEAMPEKTPRELKEMMGAAGYGGGLAVGSKLLDNPFYLLPKSVKVKIATAIMKSANKDYTKVLGAKTKGEKAQAEKIAPKLAQKKVFVWTRGGLENAAGRKVENLGTELDASYQALGDNAKVAVEPILGQISTAIDSLKVNDVLPPENAAMARNLNNIGSSIIEIAKTDKAPLQAIRQYRQILDNAVKAGKSYYPTKLNTVIRQAQSKCANILRGELASQYPSVARINAEFSFWKNTADLLAETAPKGKSILSHVGGVVGDVAGSKSVGFFIRNLSSLVSDNAAWSSFTGSQKVRMADMLSKSIEKGDITGAIKIVQRHTKAAAAKLNNERGSVLIPGKDTPGGGIIYHVTPTEYIDSIKESGLVPMKRPSNWIKSGDKTRYGKGEIYAFENPTDAAKWAAKMDWEFNKEMGSGKISIVQLKKSGKWTIDTSDPLSQAGKKGNWLKSIIGARKEDIINSIPLTSDITKKLVGDEDVGDIFPKP